MHVSSSSCDMHVSSSSQVCNVIVSSVGEELPNAKLLRLLRLGRAVKLFTALKDLNRLITAVSKSVKPVCNALLMLFIIAAIYAILGTSFFGDKSPEYFYNFSTSFFTMFQVLTEGGADLARSLFSSSDTDETGVRRTDSNVAFFFVSYMLINSIMMLNVVVAVLLVLPCVRVCVWVCVCVYIYAYTDTQDEFVSSVTREKEAEVQAHRAEQDKLKLRHTFSKAIRIMALYSRLLGHCLLRTLLQLLPRRS